MSSSPLEHYRCVKCFMPSIGSVRDIDAVQIFPKLPFVKMITEDMLLRSISDILSVLQKDPPPLDLLTLQYGDETKN